MKKGIKKYIGMSRRIREFSEKHQLTKIQLEVLLLMHAENMDSMQDRERSPNEYERRSIGEVARILGMNLSHVSHNISGLYRGRNPALIEKYINPHSQRIISLGLTKEGYRFCEEAENYIIR